MKKIMIFNPKHQNDRGMALLIVLVLSAIGLGLMTTLIYLITSGTQVSGIQRRYRTALEASMGGKDVILEVLAMKDSSMTDIDAYLASLGDIVVTYRTPSSCTGMGGLTGFQAKLRTSSSSWVDCDSTIAVDTSTATPNYDMKFDLGIYPRYTVYAKIVDTISGSAVGAATKLRGGAGVLTSQGDAIQVAGVPNMYTVEIQTENSANPQERAKLQVLYQY